MIVTGTVWAEPTAAVGHRNRAAPAPRSVNVAPAGRPDASNVTGRLAASKAWTSKAAESPPKHHVSAGSACHSEVSAFTRSSPNWLGADAEHLAVQVIQAMRTAPLG